MEMIQYKNEERKHCSKGEFKCAFDNEMIYLAIIGVILVVLVIASLPFVLSLLNFVGRRNGADFLGVIMIPFYIVFGTAFAVVLNGRTCNYDANETEFVVTGPGKRKEYFYYSDVQDITTEEFRLFGKKRGYIVTITTSVRDVQYRYIFGKNKVFTDIDGTPFYYLGLNSGLYAKTGANVDEEQVNLQFESMVLEQITMNTNREINEDDTYYNGIRRY